MKAIAGALVVLAGSVLWGAGALAAGLAYGAKAPLGYADFAAFGGAFLAFAGLVAFVTGLLQDKTPKGDEPSVTRLTLALLLGLAPFQLVTLANPAARVGWCLGRWRYSGGGEVTK